MIAAGSTILLVGCGKMGGALLKGWLQYGIEAGQVTVMDPHPGQWVSDLVEDGLTLNQLPTAAPTIIVVATKPQIMDSAVPQLRSYGPGTLILSIAAGTPIATFQTMLATGAPIIRAMPNTPASIGAGITALIGSASVTANQRAMAEQLMAAVGATVWLQEEDQMHAVTGLSGSGPAYVFALAEAMISAGENLGLGPELSRQLVISTIAGAGRLMQETGRSPSVLREEVTSPNGTTAAGLDRMMASDNTITDLMLDVVSSASDRSRAMS